MKTPENIKTMIHKAADQFAVKIGNGITSSRDSKVLRAKKVDSEVESEETDFPPAFGYPQSFGTYYVMNISGVEGTSINNRQVIPAQDKDVYLKYTEKISTFVGSGGLYWDSFHFFENPELILVTIGFVPSDTAPTLNQTSGATTAGYKYAPICRIYADGRESDALDLLSLYGEFFYNADYGVAQ